MSKVQVRYNNTDVIAYIDNNTGEITYSENCNDAEIAQLKSLLLTMGITQDQINAKQL